MTDIEILMDSKETEGNVGRPCYHADYDINHKLAEKINITRKCEISKKIAVMLKLAVELVGKRLDEEKIDIDRCCPVGLIMDNTDIISFRGSEIASAYVGTFIVLRIPSLEQNHPLWVLSAICEELTHYFFRISNEVIVKYKVLQIIRQMYPDTEMRDYMNLDIVMEHHKIPHPTLKELREYNIVNIPFEEKYVTEEFIK